MTTWRWLRQKPVGQAPDQSHAGPELAAPGHHHGHGHGGHAAPGSVAVRRLLFVITVPLVIANVIALAVLWPRTTSSTSAGSLTAAPPLIAATVTGIDVVACNTQFDADLAASTCLDVTVTLHGKAHGGEESTFQQTLNDPARLRVDNRIYVTELGTNQSKPTYGFYEYQRERPLLALLAAFVIVTILIGRRSGLRALIALALSLGILVKFMLPAIIQGRSPLLVALVGASAVMFLALYLSHGINVRTTSAVLGTMASLGITGLLATLAVKAAHFTGLSGEESSYLGATASQIDLRGLLLAGIIIGALGVLDDVTVTQASAVWELHQANPNLGFRGRFEAAIRIGRDHIASVVNTLVLAYAGAALPLLLLFTGAGTPLSEVFNGEPVATELVRMLAGSIGLIAAVPLTTALTSLVVGFDHSGSQPGSNPDTVPVETDVTVRNRQRRRNRPTPPWSPPRAEQEFWDHNQPHV
jgi:uncharacterized membrane protein